ncbi:MAG: prenyltransferase [Planctomycetaceae bacterium]|nr:MAG: prenyltransferase [Planctomycetaceae bacterium]
MRAGCRVRAAVAHFTLGALLIVLALHTPLDARAAPPGLPKTVESSGIEFITPQTQQAITRGLDFLVQAQRPDGSFGSSSNYEGHVAVTALAGLAFLGSGSTPGRGRYGAALDRAVSNIVDNTSPTGLISTEEHKLQNPMYGHGFATLFLAEVYGMSPNPKVRDKLKLAVNLILNSQNKEGGWRYFPVRREADVSVTVCQMMALRAARNAGLAVPKSTVDACVEYVRRCQNPDGGFSYNLGPGGGPGTPSLMPRSAAGLVALYSAGIYEGREIERGLRFLQDQSPRGDAFRQEAFYYYGQYYAAQAMWHAGGNYWRRWYPAIRDELLPRQQPPGNWIDMSVCPEYGTAMSCIVLQLPNNFLPIFQR